MAHYEHLETAHGAQNLFYKSCRELKNRNNNPEVRRKHSAKSEEIHENGNGQIQFHTVQLYVFNSSSFFFFLKQGLFGKRQNSKNIKSQFIFYCLI